MEHKNMRNLEHKMSKKHTEKLNIFEIRDTYRVANATKNLSANWNDKIGCVSFLYPKPLPSNNRYNKRGFWLHISED